MPGNMKKVEIVKNEAQNETGIFRQNQAFSGETFFKLNASTKFSMDFSDMFKVS